VNPVDFESTASAIPPHPLNELYFNIIILILQQFFSVPGHKLNDILFYKDKGEEFHIEVNMNCTETQNLIIPFVKNELPPEQAAEFAAHVNNCRTCKDELEINYCLMTAIMQLNEDKELTADFKKELNDKLELVTLKGRREKNSIRIKNILVIFEIIIIGIIIAL
jgi:hypothetical protein